MTTSKVEGDYFTAVDDLNTGDEHRGEAHVGEAGFAAGLFYSYIFIDRQQLIDNLSGKIELAERAIAALVEAAVRTSPKGKQNSFGSRAHASYVLAEKGDQQPRSLSVAFLRPIAGQRVLADSVRIAVKQRSPGILLRDYHTAQVPGAQAKVRYRTRRDELMAAKKPFPPGQRTSLECVQTMDQAARDWLKIRAKELGFQLPVNPEVGAYRQHALQKPGRRDAIQYSSADYEGLLEVTDPGRLIETLARGVGRAKAFGCGLMLIRRL